MKPLGFFLTFGCLGIIIVMLIFAAVCTWAFVDSIDESSTTSDLDDELEDYWQQSECFDLFDRIVEGMKQGFTSEEITQSFYQTEGAVKRYGPRRVIEHCNNKYRKTWENQSSYPIPTEAATPWGYSAMSFEEYWNKGACTELFRRIHEAMTEQGISLREIFALMEQARGPLRQYGAMKVHSYCHDTFPEEWENLW